MISGLAFLRAASRGSRRLSASSSAQWRLLADVDAVERRQREVHVAAADQLRQVPVEEREQQRRDVVAVAVGVHQEQDLAVAQLARRTPRRCRSRARVTMSAAPCSRGPSPATRCSVLSTLPRSGRIAWRLAVAPLLGRAAGAVTLDDEQLALVGSVLEQSASLPGRLSRWLTRVLRDDLLRGGALGLAGARREDDPRDDRLGRRCCSRSATARARAARRRRLAVDLGVVQALLRLALELRLERCRR